MAKCTNCKGCLEDKWVGVNHYLYCWLCDKWYKVFNKKLEEIPEPKKP